MRHVALKYFGDLEQPPRAYAVCPLFVFLNLLKRDTERLAESFLTHPGADTTRPNTLADLDLKFGGVAL